VLHFDDEALAMFDYFGKNLHKSAHAVEGLKAGWFGKRGRPTRR
jgi:hypothetical protein